MEKLIEKIIIDSLNVLKDRISKSENYFMIDENKTTGNILEAHIVSDFFLQIEKSNVLNSIQEVNIDTRMLFNLKLLSKEKYKNGDSNKRNFKIDLFCLKEKEKTIIEFKNDSKNVSRKYSHIFDLMRLNDLTKLYKLDYGIFITTKIKNLESLNSVNEEDINSFSIDIMLNKKNEILKLQEHRKNLHEKIEEWASRKHKLITIIFIKNNTSKLKSIEPKEIFNKIEKIENKNSILKLLDFEDLSLIEESIITKNNIEYFLKIMKNIIEYDKKDNINIINYLGAGVLKSTLNSLEVIQSNLNIKLINLENFNGIKSFLEIDENTEYNEDEIKKIMSYFMNINIEFKKNLKKQNIKLNDSYKSVSTYGKIWNSRSKVLESLFINEVKTLNTKSINSNSEIRKIFEDKEIKAKELFKEIWENEKDVNSIQKNVYECIKFTLWYKKSFDKIILLFDFWDFLLKKENSIEKISNSYSLENSIEKNKKQPLKISKFVKKIEKIISEGNSSKDAYSSLELLELLLIT